MNRELRARVYRESEGRWWVWAAYHAGFPHGTTFPTHAEAIAYAHPITHPTPATDKEAR